MQLAMVMMQVESLQQSSNKQFLSMQNKCYEAFIRGSAKSLNFDMSSISELNYLNQNLS
jgi:hypothetical protein